MFVCLIYLFNHLSLRSDHHLSFFRDETFKKVSSAGRTYGQKHCRYEVWPVVACSPDRLSSAVKLHEDTVHISRSRMTIAL